MKHGRSIGGKIAIAVTAAVVAVTAAIVTLVLVNRTKSYRVIKVFDINGSGSVSRKSIGDLEPYKGMNLESGDKVSTHTDSTMRITLDDTKYVFMEEESSMELVASGDASKNMTRVILSDGAVVNELSKPLSNLSSYEVNAPKASLSVVGTSFRVQVEKDSYGDYITTVQVFHGTVQITLLDEDDKPTDNVVYLMEGRMAMIKTVRKENSKNDPSVDGKSFFIIPDDDSETGYVRVSSVLDPAFDIDYPSVPYVALHEIYDNDSSGKIVLKSTVRKKVIEAMSGLRASDKKETAADDPSESSEAESSVPESTVESSSLEESSSETESSSVSDSSSSTDHETDSSSVSDSSSKKDKDKDSSSKTKDSSSKKDKDSGSKTKDSSSVKDKPDSSSQTSSSSSAPDTSTSSSELNNSSENTSSVQPDSSSSSADDKSDPRTVSGKGGSGGGYKKPYSSGSGSTGTTGSGSDSSKIDKTETQTQTQPKPVPEPEPEPEPEVYYSVIFYDRNGNIIDSTSVQKGGSVSAPRLSSEDSSYVSEDGSVYVFDGWKADLTNIQSDMRVFPKYKQIPAYISDPEGEDTTP